MRISPTRFLHGMLYTTPVILLTLAACGGGGGGGGSTPPGGSVVASYTLGGAVSGVGSTGLVLRNNGGDDLAVAPGATAYTFGTAVIAGNTYNVTVLTHPSTPTKRCTVTGPSGTMPAANVATVDVTCVAAYTIGGIGANGGGITGLIGTGLVLQNNGGDNLMIASSVSPTPFTFSTPLENGAGYSVTVLAQPHTPAQTCSTGVTASGVAVTDVNDVAISCVNNLTPPAPDRYVYTVNYDSTNISAFSSANGVLTLNGTQQGAETNPSSLVVDPAGLHLYETNWGANNIRVYDIDGSGALSLHIDADGSIAGFQDAIVTGTGPIAIAIHPSGKFAYAVNQTSNSVSGYSIDPVNGALSGMDMNGSAAGTSIPTRSSPFSIAITPDGGYAYVANAIETDTLSCANPDCGSVSAYRIHATTGALTAIAADTVSGNTYIDAGATVYSVTVDPTGQYVYVANGTGGSGANGDVWAYSINTADGSLSHILPAVLAGTGPRAVTTDPSGTHAYVVNGGSNDISAYDISPITGALTQIDCNTVGGATCNTPPNTKNFLAGTGPIAISIDSSGQYAYVANSVDSNVSAYSIDGLGALIPVGAAIGTGANPHAITTAR